MNPLFELEHKLRGLFAGLGQPDPPPEFIPTSGLLRALMEQQRPSENIHRAKPMTPTELLVRQHLVDRGLATDGHKPHPLDYPDSRWPYPPNGFDRQPTQLPLSALMRSAPSLEAMGALLEPPLTP